MRGFVAAALSLALATPASAAVVDSFDDASLWRPVPADGVGMTLSGAPGEKGGALRFDFRFTGGGYAVARRELSLDLPENYRLAFRIRGDAPVNHLEFKLVDSTGSNVWWYVKRDFAFPSEWQSVAIKKRQISFAWGPAGGGELRRAAAIEIAVTAGSGGTGTIWLDEMTIEPLAPASETPPSPVVTASSEYRRYAATNVLDADSTTAWRPADSDRAPSIAFDLGGLREFGGLRLEWLPDHPARDYDVEAQVEGDAWRVIREVRGGDGKLDLLHLPESEARRLRVRILRAGERGAALRTARVLPIAWAPTVNEYFMELAKEYPRGWFPRGFSGEQSYWTVVGGASDSAETLFSEDGAVEFMKGGFSIEPLLLVDGHLRTWADVSGSQRLLDVRWGDSLRTRIDPATQRPIVLWSTDSLHVEITATADHSPWSASRSLMFRVENMTKRARAISVVLALRPFQVNPPSQFLNGSGGAAEVHSLRRSNDTCWVDDRIPLRFHPSPKIVSAVGFDNGHAFEYISGPPPLTRDSLFEDPRGRLSATFAWPVRLQSSQTHEVRVEFVPSSPLPKPSSRPLSDVDPEPKLLTGMGLDGADVRATLDAQVAYILINRDGPAIQPGSRAYERSWIRDGAMTSSALLRMGREDVVGEYLRWFATFQYDNGKVPCCVDARGADPVPEHDSGGEFLFLLAEYLRYTNDQATIAPLWPNVVRAVAYLDTLRQQRRTEEWHAPDKIEFFGLLPPSISHEGYSAKPMHSYWDDFWALRGFRDAVYLAHALGHEKDAARFNAISEQFAGDLRASIPATMAKHRIDYVPGAADLGDFDATSTTIALSPVQAQDITPPGSLERTFERYWEFFVRRRDGTEKWDAYTPYEIRNIGAFVHLGWRDRVQELLEFFMADRRPRTWRQWPEVIRRDPRQIGFLGDLPHTWVGSDFIRSVLDMFAYQDEARSALVLAAGIPDKWLEEGIPVGVRDLRTPYGKLDYWITRKGRTLEVEIGGEFREPIEKFVLRAPGVDGRWRVRGGGSNVSKPDRHGDVVIRHAPARFTLEAPSR